MRKKYIEGAKLIDGTYNMHQINVMSSDMDRTIESVEG